MLTGARAPTGRRRRSPLEPGALDTSRRRASPPAGSNLLAEIALLIGGSGADIGPAIESFAAAVLHESGVWSSPRVSDGVVAYRVIDRSAGRIRVLARVVEIDQTQHLLWLELEADETSRTVSWTLHYDVDASVGERKARHAFDLIADPTDVEWRVRLSGAKNLP
jgi:hypothetical protein